jgi:hypothetical protein
MMYPFPPLAKVNDGVNDDSYRGTSRNSFPALFSTDYLILDITIPRSSQFQIKMFQGNYQFGESVANTRMRRPQSEGRFTPIYRDAFVKSGD